MAVKVGNSWVSETALTYAKAKSGSGTVYPQVNAVEVNATYQGWEDFFE